MTDFKIKRGDNHEWAGYRRHFEFWKEFMRAAYGIGLEFDPFLMKMLGNIYIKNEQNRLIPVDDRQLQPDDTIVTSFDHIITSYTPDSNGQESLEADNFAYEIRSENTVQESNYAVMERAKAALALVGQASAMGWQNVDISETQGWLETYLLQCACDFYGIECHNGIAPVQDKGVKQEELYQIKARFDAVREAPMSSVTPPGYGQAEPGTQQNEGPPNKEQDAPDTFEDEFAAITQSSTETRAKPA